MSNKKITDLITGTYPYDGSEYVLGVQDGQSVKLVPGIALSISTGDGSTVLPIQPTGGDVTIGSFGIGAGLSHLRNYGDIASQSYSFIDGTNNTVGSISYPTSTGYLRYDPHGFYWDGSIQAGATRNVFVGNWEIGVSYIVGDVVLDADGYGWSCITANVGSVLTMTPTYPTQSNTYWSLYSIRGTDGQNAQYVTISGDQAFKFLQRATVPVSYTHLRAHET